MNPLLVGGAMIGPQSSAVQTQLGSVINGVVNYEYWLPVPAMSFPGSRSDHGLSSACEGHARR